MPPTEITTSHPAFAETARRVTVLSDAVVRICDEEIDTKEVPWLKTDAHRYIEAPLQYAVQRLLYTRFYVQGNWEMNTSAKDDESVAAERRASVAGTTTLATHLDHGWKATNVLLDGSVVAEKGANIGTFAPGRYVNVGGPSKPKPDALISVHVPEASSDHLPGFRFHFGTAIGEPIPALNQVRFYFNCRQDSAGRLSKEISARLDRLQLPFRLKHPTNPRQFYRCDSMVIYVRGDHAFATHEQLAGIRQELRAGLDTGTPLFTRRLADGYSVAESPADNRSFGSHRCDLIAGALVEAYKKKTDDSSEKLRLIAEAFASNGVPVDRPHLNCGNDPWGIDDLSIA